MVMSILVPWAEIPRFIPHTNPTPPDQTDTTGQGIRSISDESEATEPFRPIAPTS